jgi:hypothetical protein
VILQPIARGSWHHEAGIDRAPLFTESQSIATARNPSCC